MKITMRVSAVMLLVLGAIALSGCNLGGGDTTPDGGDTTYAIGDTGPSGVGIVFYVIDDGLHGLEVAPDDQNAGNKVKWSTILNEEIGTTGTDIGTGSANTDAIIAQNNGAASAAMICRDYRAAEEGDWFLPSQDELNAIWDNLVDDGTGGNNGVGGFADDHYWSSSESSSDTAVNQDFTNGLQYPSSGKNFYARVRAVRAF